MNKVPTLLCDPNQQFRQDLALLLGKTQYHVVAEFASIDEVLASPPTGVAPELIVLGPSGGERQNIAKLRVAMPEARLVVLTSSMNGDRLIKGEDLPIHGYLSKEMKPCELTAALNRIMDGQILFQTLMAPAGVTAFSPSALRNLTAREAEILRGLVNGDNNRMIADHLSLSEALVKASARQLFRKIKAADRKRAALRSTER